MPAPTKGDRLGGSPSHERIILANLATQLFEHGRIMTTEAKAKRLRPLAEKLITKAKRGDIHSRRSVLTTVKDKGVVHTLFTEIAPTMADREGGYLRITKVGPRKGDNAPMAHDRAGDRVGRGQQEGQPGPAAAAPRRRAARGGDRRPRHPAPAADARRRRGPVRRHDAGGTRPRSSSTAPRSATPPPTPSRAPSDDVKVEEAAADETVDETTDGAHQGLTHLPHARDGAHPSGVGAVRRPGPREPSGQRGQQRSHQCSSRSAGPGPDLVGPGPLQLAAGDPAGGEGDDPDARVVGGLDVPHGVADGDGPGRGPARAAPSRWSGGPGGAWPAGRRRRSSTPSIRPSSTPIAGSIHSRSCCRPLVASTTASPLPAASAQVGGAVEGDDLVLQGLVAGECASTRRRRHDRPARRTSSSLPIPTAWWQSVMVTPSTPPSRIACHQARACR